MIYNKPLIFYLSKLAHDQNIEPSLTAIIGFPFALLFTHVTLHKRNTEYVT